MAEDFSPGRDKSPGGSLSVLVKLLCSLLQSCKMSPPECILSSGSPRRVNINESNSQSQQICQCHIITYSLSAKWENSPSSGDRDSATSSVAVAWRKKEKYIFKAFVCSRVNIWIRWWSGGLHLWGRGCWIALCVAEHPTFRTASPRLPPGLERRET